MNVYLIVEGACTETIVYPKWLEVLAPHLKQIEKPEDLTDNSYYLFSACGIPSIFKHVSNAVGDVNDINAQGGPKYDYLMVCLDTEQEDRSYILQRINEQMVADNRTPQGFQIVVFEQKVCMESWFLGNKKVFKENPYSSEYLKYISYYNVGNSDPELMGNGDQDNCDTTAQFHGRYLKEMMKERHMTYKKNRPDVVCDKSYLEELIKRFQQTNHLSSFGCWYDFVIKKL